MSLIKFAVTRPAKKGEKARAENFQMTTDEFFEFIKDAKEISSVHINKTEDKAEYARRKRKADGIVAYTSDGLRRKTSAMDRSILFFDIDRTDTRTLRRCRKAFIDAGLEHVFHTTTGDRHPLKGGTRCARFLVLTDKPVPAEDLGRVQYALLHQLGLSDVDFDDCTKDTNRLMYLPHQQSVIKCHYGKRARVRRLLRLADKLGVEKEEVRRELTQGDDAVADGILDWCFQAGFEELSSGRGYEVPCPNEHLHSGEGSTAIMVKDGEIRFKCMHTGNECCSELNRHQHLALRLIGIPDHLNVEPHNMSRKQIAAILPGLDDEEVESLYEHIVDAVGDGEEYGVCTDADLDNEPVALFSKHDPIIEGLVNFKSTWYMAGESNIGKSFYVLGKMGAVAAGIPFGGAKVVQSHCFYFDAEGGEASNQRKEALQIKYEHDLDKLHIIDLQSRGWDITSKSGLREVISFINRTANGEPVGLVAFDSLNQTVALRSADAKPFDENNASDMGEVVKALKAIAENTGGSAGVIHHPAKGANGSRSPRGSGALHGAVDSAFFLEQPDDNQPGQLNLYHEKARNGIKQAPRGFVLLKCKVKVDLRKSEAFEAHQSTSTGPDFGDVVAGWDVKPIASTPRDETLYLVPVALAPFAIEQAKAAGKAAVKEENTAGPRNEKEKVLYAALEKLMEDNPEHTGFSKSAIVRQAGLAKGGTSTKAIDDMVERGVLGFYTDPHTGAIYGSSNIVIKTNIPITLSATDDDLKD